MSSDDTTPTVHAPRASSSTNTAVTPASVSKPSKITPPSSPPPKTILLINGPNLNLLGHREPGIYGNTTLADIIDHLQTLATSRGVRVLTFQSNSEGGIVDRIHDAFWANLKAKSKPTSSIVSPPPATSETETEVQPQIQTQTQTQVQSSPSPTTTAASPGTVDAIIINPGAYTHTSVAIRDALTGVSIPFVECHISNVHAREEFRHKSFLSDKAEAVIAGLGVFGYVAALEWWCWKWKGGKLEDAGK